MKSSVELFKEGYNCSQSVFVPLTKDFMSSDKIAFQIMSPFGGGISNCNGICGAVVGGIAAIGLHLGHSEAGDTKTKNLCMKATQLFIKEFEELHIHTACSKLIGFNLNNQEEKELAARKGVFKSKCPKYVESASEIATKIIELQP